ncbi:MAG TPA: hypothetical protein VLE96_00110 [Chlamydiales bacterium]|nr:hypothetical protein [Chlamydiales bacterium]
MNLTNSEVATLKSPLLGWGMVLLFVILNITGALLLKNQIQKLGSWEFTSIRSLPLFFTQLFFSWTTLVAIGSLFASTIAWSLALANLELSKAYPVAIGLNFLLIMLSATFFYGESIGLQKLSGILLILLGIISLLK